MKKNEQSKGFLKWTNIHIVGVQHTQSEDRERDRKTI